MQLNIIPNNSIFKTKITKHNLIHELTIPKKKPCNGIGIEDFELKLYSNRQEFDRLNQTKSVS